jgi:hypothetical protein
MVRNRRPDLVYFSYRLEMDRPIYVIKYGTVLTVLSFESDKDKKSKGMGLKENVRYSDATFFSPQKKTSRLTVTILNSTFSDWL